MTPEATVLIVEDHSMVAIVLQKILERRDYRVCEIVTTGEDAVEAAANHRPDLVLLDIQLPGDVDGVEVARRIAETHDAAFIFLTGYALDEVRERVGALTHAAYLRKPVENEDLIAAVEEILAR